MYSTSIVAQHNLSDCVTLSIRLCNRVRDCIEEMYDVQLLVFQHQCRKRLYDTQEYQISAHSGWDRFAPNGTNIKKLIHHIKTR